MDLREKKARVKKFGADKNWRKRAYAGRVKWASKMLNFATHNKKKIGVEVGLWKADFAYLMLHNDPNLTWYGVDPYFEYGKKHRRQKEWDGTFDRVAKKMAKFGDRMKFVRFPSHEAPPHIPDGVDFIFIDGNHDYDFVYKDLLLFEPKVRSGGFLAGHDSYGAQVKRAVVDYAKKFNREVTYDDSFDPCEVFWWKVP